MITRPPARQIATIPVTHAASSSRNAGPTETAPSGPISIPSAAPSIAAGIASTKSSTLKASHGSSSTA